MLDFDDRSIQSDGSLAVADQRLTYRDCTATCVGRWTPREELNATAGVLSHFLRRCTTVVIGSTTGLQPQAGILGCVVAHSDLDGDKGSSSYYEAVRTLVH